MKTHPCPPWCVEHYTAEDGTINHSGPINRGVVGESASSGEPMQFNVWPELRVTIDGHVYPVGILGETHREPDDMELTPEQLRRLAAHCIAIAQMCEQVIAERNATTDAANGGDTKCAAVSSLLSPVQRQEDASDVASGDGQSAVTECVTNTATTTTTRRTEQTVCAATTAPNLTHEVTQ